MLFVVACVASEFEVVACCYPGVWTSRAHPMVRGCGIQSVAGGVDGVGEFGVPTHKSFLQPL